MAFGDVLQSAVAPGSTPSGIGGDSNTVWYQDYGALIYELNTTDLSTIRSGSSPGGSSAHGIGGNTSTIWHSDYGTDLIYELNITDFSTVRSAAAPSTAPRGIGGDSNTIWHSDPDSDLVYELSTTDLSVVRSASSPGNFPYETGGNSSVIWIIDSGLDTIYELSTTDFSISQSVSSPSSYPRGIGGNETTIWHSDYNSGLVYELEGNAAYTISGTVYKGDGTPNVGITVRVTNITNDEYADDTSDANGEYSVDLYNLTTPPSDNDSIKVRCYSVYKTTTVDETNYPTGRTVNLTCFGRFQINGADVTGVIGHKVSKTIGQAAWNSETTLENKNGRRTTDYHSFQSLQIDIDGVTLLKGRLRDIDINNQHLLKISGENYSVLMNDRMITSAQAAGSTFANKSIYYAITDSSDGIAPNYLPGITTTNVANDANTQVTFTKTFNKQSVSNALTWLGEIASGTGYVFYIDNDQDLHFEERRTIDTGFTLTNTGSRKSILSWDWRNSSGKDIYNRVRIIGTGVDVTRNDISSQTEFGIREHPTITDTGLTVTADANSVGDNILARYANPFKEVTLKCKTNANVADSTFPIVFIAYFSGYHGLLYLQPGDLVRTDIANIGVPQSNVFPWRFTTDFTPEKRIVLSVEHQFPQYISTIKLSEYYKDLSTMVADTVKKEI